MAGGGPGGGGGTNTAPFLDQQCEIYNTSFPVGSRMTGLLANSTRNRCKPFSLFVIHDYYRHLQVLEDKYFLQLKSRHEGLDIVSTYNIQEFQVVLCPFNNLKQA